jgi:hypothetical protein
MSRHNGTIEFSSKPGLFLFKTARVFARLSLICGIIAGLMFVGRDIDLPKPTLADAAPTIALFGSWLLLKILMSVRIEKGMRNAASRQGMPYRQYVQKTRRRKFGTTLALSREAQYPKTKKGQQRRWEDAVDLLHYGISRDTAELRTVRLLAQDPEGSERALVRAQNMGQAIVDRDCRHFAIKEYAERNDVLWTRVSDMIRKENGRGPVTKAVDEIYGKVHYEYRAYFENKEHTWKGHTLKQGVGGTKKRVHYQR